VSSTRHSFVHALGFERLTSLYDPVVRITTREQTFKRRLLDQARLAPGDRVLDLGCGTGTLAIWAKLREPGARVTGVDADPGMLERARSKAAAEGVEVRLDEGLADDLPYPDASFDKVLSTLLFHHLPRDVKEGAGREVARVLRPGGELHVADFGRPPGPLARGQFLMVQAFDGFEATRDNVNGDLPEILSAGGMEEVRERGRLRLVLGSLSFYSGRRAG
jgi:ubiquinone/menaquinone biosynthesis C-methylase UbiE